MVMMLMQKGVKSPKVANEIALMGLDCATVEQSIDNLLADKTSIPAIIGYLQTAPPAPGQPYPRLKQSISAPPPARPKPVDRMTPQQLADLAARRRNNSHDTP